MSPARDPKQYARDRHAANPRERLGAHLHKAYGLTLAQYDALWRSQGGLCAVCDRPPKSGHRLHVDHDHVTGLVRALLCGSCNSALGQMGESIDLLWKLLDYAQHCAEGREWFLGDPIRRAVSRAYKRSLDLPQRRQLVLEAMQRLRNAPVREVMAGRRGREVAKILDELAAADAAKRAALPEVAPVRVGGAYEAVFA